MKRKRVVFTYLIIFIIAGGTFALSNVIREPTSGALEASEKNTYISKPTGAVEDGNYLRVPLGSILLEPLKGIEAKRSPVNFPHGAHFDYKCQNCHHKWEGKQLKSCSASNCHDQVKTPEKTEGKKISPEDRIKNFKIAYHQQCITCHKDQKAKNLELELSLKPIKGKIAANLPTGCIECHPKAD